MTHHSTAVFVFALVLVVLSVGCMAEKKIGRVELSENLFHTHSIRGGLDIEILEFDLDDDAKTTPVHPHDASFLSGDTSVSIEEDRWKNPNFVPWVGWDTKTGTENLQAVGGFSLRLNTASLNDEYQEGYYGVDQQISDTRGGYGSFNYSRAEIGLLTFEPDVGVRCQHEALWAEFRIGFPHTQFKSESGWDRWGMWEKYQSEDWSGFGQRLSVTIGTTTDDDGPDIALRGYVVRYDTSFGEVSGGGGSVVVAW